MINISDNYLKKLVAETRELLESSGGAKALQEELNYYQPSKLRSAFSTISHIHVRLADSIRNAARMRLVITDSHYRLIANKLMSYSLDSICNGGLEVIAKIIAMNCQVSDDDQNNKRSWSIFKQGVVDSACYLASFKDTKGFYSYVDSNTDTVGRAWNLALELDQIKGIGPPLACDFLKEIGVDCYGKPDVHIKRTFDKLKLIGKDNQDREAFEMLWHMAHISSCSTAEVDKIFWMAASGRWDKTLDQNLNEHNRRVQQLHRKQRFASFLEQIASGA